MDYLAWTERVSRFGARPDLRAARRGDRAGGAPGPARVLGAGVDLPRGAPPAREIVRSGVNVTRAVQDGQEWNIQLQLTPVIPKLIKAPLF